MGVEVFFCSIFSKMSIGELSLVLIVFSVLVVFRVIDELMRFGLIKSPSEKAICNSIEVLRKDIDNVADSVANCGFSKNLEGELSEINDVLYKSYDILRVLRRLHPEGVGASPPPHICRVEELLRNFDNVDKDNDEVMKRIEVVMKEVFKLREVISEVPPLLGRVERAHVEWKQHIVHQYDQIISLFNSIIRVWGED